MLAFFESSSGNIIINITMRKKKIAQMQNIGLIIKEIFSERDDLDHVYDYSP
jgi:hypothetical protein